MRQAGIIRIQYLIQTQLWQVYESAYLSKHNLKGWKVQEDKYRSEQLFQNEKHSNDIGVTRYKQQFLLCY